MISDDGPMIFGVEVWRLWISVEEAEVSSTYQDWVPDSCTPHPPQLNN